MFEKSLKQVENCSGNETVPSSQSPDERAWPLVWDLPGNVMLLMIFGNVLILFPPD